MKRLIIIFLMIFLSLCLEGEDNNHAVIITGADVDDVREAGEHGFPMLFDGQFLKENFESDKYVNHPYNSFWNDTYLMWELMWYYKKFSLYEFSFSKDYDRIFVLYGNGDDETPRWERYQGIHHREHGWLHPYEITDYYATNDNLDIVISNLKNGYNHGYIPPMTSDDNLFCWTFDHGTSAWCVHSVDFIDPENPVPLDYAGTEFRSEGLDVQGDYAYSVGFKLQYGQLMITDITNPSSLQEIATLEGDYRPRAIDVDGNYAYIAACCGSRPSFTVVDISSPANPVIIGRNDHYPYLDDVEVEDLYAYCIEFMNSCFIVYDVSDPTNPEDIGVCGTNSFPRDLAVKNDQVAYVGIGVTGHKQLLEIDISDKTNPYISNSKDLPRYPRAIEVDSDYIYIVGGRGLLILDDQYNIIYNGSLPSSYNSGGLGDQINVSLKNDTLYIGFFGAGLITVDVTNPASPQIVSHYNPDGLYFTEAIRNNNSVYMSGWGPEGSSASLCLKGYPIQDWEFAQKFSQVPANKKVYWMQQCYSGGFIDDLEGENTVISTACEETELAWSADDIPWYNIDSWQSGPNPSQNWEDYVVEGTENEIVDNMTYYHGEFDYHIMNSIRREDPDGDNLAPHSSFDDYLISMEEAYNYVNSWDSRKYPIMDPNGNILPPEHPQYSDIGNIGDMTFIGWDDGLAPLPPEGLDYSVSSYPPNPDYVIVDLTWDTNTEEDLVAYRVYHKVLGGNWEHLTYTDVANCSHKVEKGSVHYYYVRAYDMMKQESEPSDIIMVVAIPGGPAKYAAGGNENPSDKTIYRDGYIDNTTFEYPEKKVDFGDSLVYSMDVSNATFLIHLYYSKGDNVHDFYVNDNRVDEIMHGNGLISYSIYPLTGYSGEAIIKLKGVNGRSYMSFLVAVDKRIKDTKGDIASITGNENESIRLVSRISRDKLQIEELKWFIEDIELDIYDVQGRKVMSKRLKPLNENVIEIPHNLINGVYIMRLRTENEEYKERFTVIR